MLNETVKTLREGLTEAQREDLETLEGKYAKFLK